MLFMIFIFGVGYTKTYNYRAEKEFECPRCGNNVFLNLTKITKWFTMFFIPVFPYETKYIISCPDCKYEVSVDKIKFDNLKLNN
jgi:transcription elongation factor Elf1